MTTMRTDGRGSTWRGRAAITALLAAIALAAAPAALAQYGPGGGGGGGGGDMRGGGYRGGDPRGGPGGYYVPPGARGPGEWHGPPPPRGGYYGGGYYGGGYYYPPHAHYPYYARPPLGFAVTVLPPYYTTFWYAGVPYFYVDGTYYLWRERERHYEVVEAPAEAANTAPASTPDDLFVYPKGGQSEELQSKDRYECHRWAAGQTGYDPTQPSAADAERTKREEYRRAMTACLEGRGYSVK